MNESLKGLTINAYCDADWGSDPEDARSTTGYIIQLNGCTISWCSKKQKTIALSSAEAEYMALVEAIKEIIWIKQLLSEMVPLVNIVSTHLYCDNQAAIAISKNDVHHDRTKHINIRYHFIREVISNKEVELHWIATTDQLADIFTKPLGRNKLNKLKGLVLGEEY